MKNYILISAIASILLACSVKTKNESVVADTAETINSVSLTDEQFKNSKIILGKLTYQSISSVIKVNGKIDVPPQNMISVSMPLGGYLKTTKLLPGMHVSKGEIIACMEDLQYIQLQQEFLTTQSKLVFAETELNRQKELNVSKANSDKVLQQAQLDYTAQKISLSALSEKLKLININPNTLSESNLSKSANIYSPIDGFVSKVNVNIGKYVNPADVLFELVNTKDIHLNLKIFESDLSSLAIGQKVFAYNNQSNRKHPCEIILISQDLSTERTAEVHCHFNDYDKTLLPGMYMNADIEVKKENAYTLPEEAIVSFEGKNYVFVNKKNKEYIFTEVQLGAKENGFIEIIQPEFLMDKSVVITGAYNLLMKLKNTEEE